LIKALPIRNWRAAGHDIFLSFSNTISACFNFLSRLFKLILSVFAANSGSHIHQLEGKKPAGCTIPTPFQANAVPTMAIIFLYKIHHWLYIVLLVVNFISFW